MTTKTNITWTTTDLTRDRIDRMLGHVYVEQILALGPKAALARCCARATGAWTANEREHYAAYRSLAQLIAGGILADYLGGEVLS